MKLFSKKPSMTFLVLLALLVFVAVVYFKFNALVSACFNLCQLLMSMTSELRPAVPVWFYWTAFMFALHGGFLWIFRKRLTITMARWISGVTFIILAIVPVVLKTVMSGHGQNTQDFFTLIFGNIIMIILFGRIIIAFSIPSSLAGLLPLAIFYATLGAYSYGIAHGNFPPVMSLSLVIMFAGLWFPMHRNWKEYWCPAPLPKIKPWNGKDAAR